jgi:uridine kinase
MVGTATKRNMMIVVVEGINAAGKTTWCRSHGQSYLIPETGKR